MKNNTETFKKYLQVRTVGFVLFSFAFFIFTSDASAATIGRPQNNLGLVGYWDFDVGKGGTTAYDRSGNGNDGTLTNDQGESSWSDGVIGQSFNSLVDVQDHVAVADSSSLKVVGDLTLSVWVKANGYADERQGIIHKHYNNEYSLTQNTNGSLQFYHGDGAWEHAGSFPSGTIVDNEWVHVVVVRDISEMKTYSYANGSLVTESSFSKVPVAATDEVRLGMRESSSYEYQGKLDEVRIYNRALSAGEVDRLYKLGQSGGQKIATSKAVVPDGLIGHWTLDGDVTNANTTSDVSGNGNTGTLTNGPQPTAGKMGQGLEFDGVDDYVTIGQPSAFDFLENESFSVSFWVRVTGEDIVWPILVGKTLASTNEWSIWWNTGNPGNSGVVRLELNGDNGNRDTVSTNSVLDKEKGWMHVTAIYDGSEKEMYMYNDGILANQNSYSDTGGFDGVQDVEFGRDPARSARVLSGSLDDIRIYDRTLSADEVERIYNAGASEKINTSRASRFTKGLVGHWTFDGDVTNANTTSDVSGNDNTGTLKNSPAPAIGKLSQALEFDGSNTDNNNTVTVPVGSTNPELSILGDVTVTGWIKPSSDYSDTSEAVLRNGQGADLEYSMFYDPTNQRPYFHWYDGSFKQVNGTSGSVPLDEWSYVTIVRSGTNLSFYVDGEFTNTGTVTAPTEVSNELAIGRTDNAGVPQDFTGLVDDVRIYNRALSKEEIEGLYNMGR